MEIAARPSVPRAALVLHALLAGVLLSGCSADDDPAAGTSAPATTTSSAEASGQATGNPSTGQPAPPVDTAPPGVAVRTLPPVPVGAPTAISDDVLVTVDGLRTLTVSGTGPGETAGDAAAFTVEVGNETSEPVHVGGFAVTASYGGGIPASPSSAAPAEPLTGQLAAGGTATGTYVFRMPVAQVGSMVIEVSSNTSPNVVVVRR